MKRRGSHRVGLASACAVLAPLCFVLGVGSAHASSSYPPKIKATWSVPEPACTLCHKTIDGGSNTVTKAFGRDAVASFGLTGSNPNLLTSVLKSMKAAGTDSDHDGSDNYSELQVGTDPNDAKSHPAPVVMPGEGGAGGTASEPTGSAGSPELQPCTPARNEFPAPEYGCSIVRRPGAPFGALPFVGIGAALSTLRRTRRSRRGSVSWLLAAVLAASCFPETAPEQADGKGGRSGVIHAGAGGGVQTSTGGTAGVPGEPAGGVPSDRDPSGGEAGASLPPPNGRCVVATASLKYPAREVVMSAAARPTEEEVFVSTLFNEFSAQCGRCHVLGSSGGLRVTELSFPDVDGKKLIARIKDGTMPPDRPQDDAVAHLVNSLNQWVTAGSPKDVIRVPLPPSDTDPYLLPIDVGEKLTNLGNCVPESTFPFAWERKKMRELDALFASLGPVQTDLPKTLDQTDLFSLDSAVLGRYGVIAFAPGYPLWSDGSGKIRHVRVPYGQSIRFDKQTQQFDIPPNTRFYKTFLKPIVDIDGQHHYRKIETRLIVTRPDAGQGLGQSTALFGSYKWNATETQATLQNAVDQPLHNGEAFADEVLTYITDEPAAQAIRDKNPANLTFEYERAKVTRHYAIPGRDRCVQCHMGSPSQDFVLGFTPLQLVRRSMGEGGVFEPSEGDELTQLERLVTLGVISGIDSVADVVPLEATQGKRIPRNEHELTAQGYMLGNCAHCHNPRGYPSSLAPELKVLNFYPGWPNPDSTLGGIFEFPLELKSARVARGLEARPIHYITPSLKDLMPYNWPDRVAESTYHPKWDYTPGIPPTKYYDAPWRSLIFRNVHNPFAYADDYAIFPHMPMNTAGYDCRARQLLGDWMVSIPGRRKHEELREDYIAPKNQPGNGPLDDARSMDNEPQPYVDACNPAHEIAGCLDGGADGFAAAVDAATKRVAAFHASPEYQCPDSSDIIDPAVGRQKAEAGDLVITPLDVQQPIDGVPDRTHWVSTDLTEPAVDWEPRQPSWERVLLHQDFPPVDTTNTPKVEAREEEKKVVAILSTMNLTASFKQFATTPYPLGLWKTKDECKKQLAGSGVQKVSSFSGAQRLRWMDISKPSADAPVYQNLPGGAIYDMVCVNCHGRGFDAQGRQAETVQLMTGGDARVANFARGLFGPSDSPGANRERVFKPVTSSSITVDDLGARYMAWMALGGTDKTIPQAVLQIVSRTDVVGTRRKEALLQDASANMLAAGKVACGFVLPLASHSVDGNGPNLFALGAEYTPLINTNGDAELWQRVCSQGNRPVIRVLTGKGQWRTGSGNLYRGENYPAGTAIGNHFGKIVKWQDGSENLFPWCVEGPYTPLEGQPEVPLCPQSLLMSANLLSNDELADWTRHGALNAGMAVFMYIDQVTRGLWNPRRYDECETLPIP